MFCSVQLPTVLQCTSACLPLTSVLHYPSISRCTAGRQCPRLIAPKRTNISGHYRPTWPSSTSLLCSTFFHVCAMDSPHSVAHWTSNRFWFSSGSVTDWPRGTQQLEWLTCIRRTNQVAQRTLLTKGSIGSTQETTRTTQNE